MRQLILCMAADLALILSIAAYLAADYAYLAADLAGGCVYTGNCS